MSGVFRLEAALVRGIRSALRIAGRVVSWIGYGFLLVVALVDIPGASTIGAGTCDRGVAGIALVVFGLLGSSAGLG